MPFCTQIQDMMLRDNEKTHDPQTDAAVKKLAEKRKAVKDCIERFTKLNDYATGYCNTNDAFAKDLRNLKMHEADSVSDQLDAIGATFHSENDKALPVIKAQTDRLRAFLTSCTEFDRLHDATTTKRVDYDSARKKLSGAKQKNKQGAEAKTQAKEQKAALYEKAYQESNRDLLSLAARKTAEGAYLVTDSTQIVLAAVADSFSEIGRCWQRERQLHVFVPAIQPVSQQQQLQQQQQQPNGVVAPLNQQQLQQQPQQQGYPQQLQHQQQGYPQQQQQQHQQQPGLDASHLYSAPHTAPATPNHPTKEQPALPPQQPAFDQQWQQQHQYQQQQQPYQQQPQQQQPQAGPVMAGQAPLHQQPDQQQQPQQQQYRANSYENATVPVGPQPYAYQQQQPLQSQQAPPAKPLSPTGPPPPQHFASTSTQRPLQSCEMGRVGDAQQQQQQQPALVHSG